MNKDGSLGIDFSIVKKPIDFSVTLNALAERSAQPPAGKPARRHAGRTPCHHLHRR